MANKDKEKRKVIIITKKRHHGGHHGGSWKVAYADFVTAMMAFFLLMWLINMVPQEKKAVLSVYFKSFSLFQKGGKSFFFEDGKDIAKGESADQGGGLVSKEDARPSKGISPDDLKGLLKSAIEAEFPALQDQVIVITDKNGVLIHIIDKEGREMFPPGSAQINENGKKIIRLIAELTKDLPTAIVVEGHTDRSRVPAEQNMKWELSTARACAARKELEGNGINPARFALVLGYADTIPLDQDRPADPINRRISITFAFRSPGNIGSTGSEGIEDFLRSK